MSGAQSGSTQAPLANFGEFPQPSKHIELQSCGPIDATARRRETAAMEPQSADAVLLVRPAAFGFNAEAAQSNVFAHASPDGDLQRKALAEFDALATRLSDAGVDVLLLDDTPSPPKPDAVFPNNWFSTHADGTMVLYPMATEPRRLERRTEDVHSLVESHGFDVRRVIDLSGSEERGRFLEGTGRLVLDRPRRRAYANLSPRTDAEIVADFDRQIGYSTLIVDARDPGGRPIYHTNVFLGLGTKFALLCLDAVAEQDRERLVSDLHAGGRSLIELTFAQLRRFGCNVLELRSHSGDPVIAMSAKALSNLKADQVQLLEQFGSLVAVDIPTIEAVGGGSVRCMIAEIHLLRR
jgi:hypothetical protein